MKKVVDDKVIDYSNKKNLKIIILSLILIIVAGASIFCFSKIFKKDEPPKLEIIINGGEKFTSEVNEEYHDAGVMLKYGGEKIPTLEYIVSSVGSVDTTKLGDYEIKYSIIYEGETYEKTRIVTVKDTKAPELTTNVEKVEKYYCNLQNKSQITAQAIDAFEGDLSSSISREEKEDKYIFKVSDSSGNEATKELPVEVEPEPAPIVKLKGAKTVYVVQGKTYSELGATATDGCGNAIDAEVVTSGTVDTNTLGTYTITYSVKYKEMEGSATRTVKVVDKITSTSGVGKTVYLTFDDGPGAYTQQLLDLLDKYDVKVTFFVTNQFPKYQYLIGEEARRGHSVAVHSLTHSWDIYTSYAAYRADFDAMNDIIEQQTGYRSKLFRFPGGSSNTKACYRSTEGNVILTIKNNMEAEGIVYFDWNVDSNDAGGAGTQQAYQNVINGMAKNTNSVVLMHDIHKTSIPAVEMIIQYGIDNGYTFAALNTSSPTAHHGIKTCK